MGYDPKDIGTHSIRKGAASYASSGSTECPPHSAVCARAGWTMGDVLDRYLKHQKASDRYVGRVLAGLNVLSYEFGILPPHFSNKCDRSNDLISVFGDTSKEILGIYAFQEYALASIIYHKKWTEAVLPQDHTFKKSVVFRGSFSNSDEVKTGFSYHYESDVAELAQIRKELNHDLGVTFNENIGSMFATGIPPSVLRSWDTHQLLVGMQGFKDGIEEKLEYVMEHSYDKIVEEMDKRCLTGNVSLSQIKDVVGNMVGRVEEKIENVSKKLDCPNVSFQNNDVQNESSLVLTVVRPLIQWEIDGVYRKIPESFAWPDTMAQLWLAYWVGDDNKGTWPLRYLSDDDIRLLKRGSNLKREMNQLMRIVTREGENLKLFSEKEIKYEPKAAQVGVWWNVLKPIIQAKMKNKKRIDQVKWRTVLDNIKQYKRKAKA